jgi:uncharacterized membrane protein YccC
MRITLELTAEVEQELRSALADGDDAAFERAIGQAAAPAVRAQFDDETPQAREARVRDMFERVDALLAASPTARRSPLPDSALTRESFYRRKWGEPTAP